MKPRSALLIAVAILLLAKSSNGGYPTPSQHTNQIRQASMVMLRFQDALANQKWDDALRLCSQRVQEKAAQWSSTLAFFGDTVPIERLLANPRFEYCREQHHDQTGFHRYGLFVPLPEPGDQPKVSWNWHWSIVTENNSWVVDFEPQSIDLEKLIAAKKESLRKRDAQIATIRRELAPKLRGVKTLLIALNDQHTVGAPMLFRVELLNLGTEPIRFTAAGVDIEPLTVLNDKREPLPFERTPVQVQQRREELAAGASVVLADKIDLAKQYKIDKSGKYFVQFNGLPLAIGEPMTVPKNEDFDEQEMFVTATSTFPSNMIEIDVVDQAR